MPPKLHLKLADGQQATIEAPANTLPGEALDSFLHGGGPFVQEPGWLKAVEGFHVRYDAIMTARLEDSD